MSIYQKKREFIYTLQSARSAYAKERREKRLLDATPISRRGQGHTTLPKKPQKKATPANDQRWPSENMDSKTTETEERTKSKTLVSYSHPQHQPLCQTDSSLRRDLQISQCNLSAYKAYLFWRNFKGFGFLRINSYECQMQIQKNQREFSFSTSCREKAQEIFHPLKTLWKNSYGLSCACILIPPFFLFSCVKIPPKTNRLLSSFFLQLETCIHLSNHNFFQKKENF